MENPCTVVLFDAEGRVRTATSGAGALLGGAHLEPGVSVAEAFGATPELQQWVAITADRVRTTGDGDSCVVGDGNGAKLQVCVLPTDGGDGFALAAAPSEPPALDGAEVSQRAWHDIKNQLGGLKLYATFLKMKLGKEDDLVRETSEKIVKGIDAIVVSIAELRSGGDKTKGEEA